MAPECMFTSPLWKNGKPLFAGKGYAGLSDLAMHYVGGILKHARALCAFSNPITNSYRRLVPGFEAPVNLAYSARNRSAAVRVPNVFSQPQGKENRDQVPGSFMQRLPDVFRYVDGWT